MIIISQIYKSGPHLLIHCLSPIVEQATGLTLYAQELAFQRDDYPLFSFLMVTPDHEELADYPDHRIYQTVLQLDAHASDLWQAQQLASDLHEALHDPGYKRFLSQVGIRFGRVGDILSHNAMLGSNYDYSQGFDVTFNMVSGYQFSDDELDFTYSPQINIKSATIDNPIGGGVINSGQQEE